MKVYKKARRLFSKNEKKEKEIKERGIIIYKSYDKFSFYQFFVTTAESRPFEILMAIIILINTILCTASAEYVVKHNGEDLDIFNVLEIFFISTYTVEFFIKIVAFPLKYWFDPWNIFDFIILVLSFLPYFGQLANLSFLRVIRAFRLVRLVRRNEDLQVLLSSILHTIRRSIGLAFMLFVFILIFAISALYLFGSKIQDPWGKLETSILSIFAITTADAWAVYQDDLDDQYGEVSRIFSVLAVLLLGIIFSSLVTASVSDDFSETSEKHRKKGKNSLKNKNRRYKDKVKANEADVKKKHFIKAKEDAKLYNNVAYNSNEDGLKLESKGPIDTQKNIFENPQWMNSLRLILLEMKKDNKRKKRLYNDMFRTMLELSDFTNSPKRKAEFNEKKPE